MIGLTKGEETDENRLSNNSDLKYIHLVNNNKETIKKLWIKAESLDLTNEIIQVNQISLHQEENIPISLLNLNKTSKQTIQGKKEFQYDFLSCLINVCWGSIIDNQSDVLIFSWDDIEPYECHLVMEYLEKSIHNNIIIEIKNNISSDHISGLLCSSKEDSPLKYNKILIIFGMKKFSCNSLKLLDHFSLIIGEYLDEISSSFSSVTLSPIGNSKLTFFFFLFISLTFLYFSSFFFLIYFF